MKTLLAAVLTAGLWSASAQQLSIDWYKISGGGGTSTGGVFTVSGTIGQPEAGGTASGGRFAVAGGFWSFVSAVQMPGSPRLTITHAGNNVVVSWPYPSTGFVLQQNNGLNASDWIDAGFTIATNATVNSVTITNPAGNLFLRLKQ